MKSSAPSFKDVSDNEPYRILKYTHRISEITIIAIPEPFVKKLAIDNTTKIEVTLTADGIFLKPVKINQSGAP